MSAEEILKVQLSKEDMLVAENLSLKMINVAAQSQQLQAYVQQELRKMNQERVQYQKEFDDHRQHCKEVYGVDIVEVELSSDGTVLGPKKAQPPPTNLPTR